MVNVTVINLKSITKYLVWIAILGIGIAGTRFFLTNKNKPEIFKEVSKMSFTACLDTTLPDIEGKSEVSKLDAKKITSRGSTLRRMLNVELPMLDTLIVEGEEELPQEIEQIDMAKTDVSTQEIQQNNSTRKI